MTEAAAAGTPCEICEEQVRKPQWCCSAGLSCAANSHTSADSCDAKLLSALQVPGLRHYKGFLSGSDQAHVQVLFELEGFFEHGNQVMLFGVDHIPAWLMELSRRLPVGYFPEQVHCMRLL